MAVQPPPRRRRRRWPWIVLGAAGFVVLVLIAVAVIAVHEYDKRVDVGGPSPDAAAYGWVMTFNPDHRHEQVGISRLAHPSRRGALMRQRDDYIRLIEDDTAKHGWNPVRFGTNGGDQDQEEQHGDRASAVLWMQTLSWDQDHPGYTFSGEAQPWRFELRHTSGGWRVWSFTPPAWCGGYSTCDQPRTNPTPTPSPSGVTPTHANPLASLTPAAPCDPGDPLRDLRSCPPLSPSP